jgi:hypothetical protein
MAALLNSLPTYDTNFQPRIKNVTLTEKILGIRLNRATSDNIGAKVVLVRKNSASHKVGVEPGCILVSANTFHCTAQTYPDIIHYLKTATRPLHLVLSVPKTNSEVLIGLQKNTKSAFLSIFAVVLGHLTQMHHWEDDEDDEDGNEAGATGGYTHSLLRQTCGMFGLDDEQTMSFVPLLSMCVDMNTPLQIKDAVSGFLPHLNLSLQEICQVVISSLTLHCISCQVYDARARCVWRSVSACVGNFPSAWFNQEESRLAERVQAEIHLMDVMGQVPSSGSSQEVDQVQSESGESKSASTTSSSTFSWNRMKKSMQIGGAVVVGAALIGLTAGLAAPAIAGGVAAVGTGLGITAASAGVVTFLSSTGGIVALSSVMGASGGGLTGWKMSKRLEEVKDFEFQELFANEENADEENEDEENNNSDLKPHMIKPHMSTVLCVSGWIDKKSTSAMQWQNAFTLLRNGTSTPAEISILSEQASQFVVLNWEREELKTLGKAMSSLAAETALQYGASEVAKNTFFAGLMSALAWPATLMTLANYIDNSWSIAINRAVSWLFLYCVD